MRSSFLAVFLILVGVVFLTATIRGRAPLLYDAIALAAGSSSNGQKGTRTSDQTGTRPPRRHA